MLDAWLGLPGDEKILVALFVLAPYLFMATGRLVPASWVKKVWELYYKSEEARERDRQTLNTLVGFAESTDHIVRAAFAPALARENPPPHDGVEGGTTHGSGP